MLFAACAGAFGFAFVCLFSAKALAAESSVRGYIVDLPKEPTAAREARHKRIAERRKGPVVIVHRGASAFAPENTLTAYAAAMDYGADGVEIDPRRTADGVIVLFHDDMLENLTNGFGKVSRLTYYELLCLKRRSVPGTAKARTDIPTLASLLALARQRAMLLHLDIKEPGLDLEIAKMLGEADMWDHVVSVNTQNAENLLKNPKLKMLRYKAPGLYLDRLDVDIEATTASLAQPGEMIIVDDPRVPAKVLNRPAYQPVPIPKELTRDVIPAHTVSESRPDAIAPLTKGLDVGSIDGLLKLLDTNEAGRTEPDGDPSYQRERREKILARAWAAYRIGEIGKKNDRMVRLLEYQVRHRSLDRDWRYHGLDGAMAVRALGMIGAVESVPMLVRTLMTVDPRLSKAASPERPDTPIAFLDWRIKEAIVDALGRLRCSESKKGLTEYVEMTEAKARELCFPMYAGAVKSLMNQKMSEKEIGTLLRSPNREVRGTAVLECLDHPTSQRTAALKAAAPWALELPRADDG